MAITRAKGGQKQAKGGQKQSKSVEPSNAASKRAPKRKKADFMAPSKTRDRKKPRKADPVVIASSNCEFKRGTLSRDMESAAREEGYEWVAGVDEAGRGPLAGPVVAAACMMPPSLTFEGIFDSKQLKEEEREELFKQLTTHPDVHWAAAVVDHKRIDVINILQASMEAMAIAVKRLKKAQFVLVDGPRVPSQLEVPAEPVIKGDSKCYIIGAASIIAKVTRDRLMLELDKKYPEYGLAQHKGYPTREHCAAVFKHGPSPVHRLTFAPIKTMSLGKYKKYKTHANDPQYLADKAAVVAKKAAEAAAKKTAKAASKKSSKNFKKQ